MEQVKSITELTGEETFFSTFEQPKTKEEKLKFHKVISTKDRIKDIKGKFEITGMYAIPVKVKDKSTGEVMDSIRIVITDKGGNAYASASPTMVKAIISLCEELWYPTAEDTLPVVVVSGKNEKGEYFTIEIAE